MKKFFKKILPDFILKFIRDCRYGFFGPYKSWEDAKKKATGYDDNVILEKVKQALLKIKSGQAIYERDSVVFEKPDYSWPILSILLFIASKNGNKLNVIDFGGSLGSTYFQNLPFLKHLSELKWNVVEQSNFVKVGQDSFTDEHLKFYSSIEECLEKENPTVIIFSSVIEYLEKPYEMLDKVIKNKFEYVIFDRTTFVEKGDDIITLQKVPPQVYLASYPCWFFSKSKLLNFFSDKYNIIAEFQALGGKIRQFFIRGEYQGFVLNIKK